MNAQALGLESGLPTRDEMLGFFSLAVSRIVEIKISNIEITPRFNFRPHECSFEIVVYDKDSPENTTFRFYDFWNREHITANFDKAIEAIKTDDISKIKHVCDTL